MVSGLLQAGMSVVTMLPRLTHLLVQRAVQRPQILVPAMVRQHLHSNPSISNQSTSHAGALLEFSMSDVDDGDVSCLRELYGLPLLPLLDGRVASLGDTTGTTPTLYVPTAAETELFGKHAPQSLLDIEAVSSELGQRLRDIAAKEKTTLRCVTIPALVQVLLPAVLHVAWRGQKVAAWTDEPSEEWVRGLWSWMANQKEQDLLLLALYPVLPTTSHQLVAPQPLQLSTTLVPEGAEWLEALSSLLQKLGCFILDDSLMNTSMPGLRVVAHRPTGLGVLACLHNQLKSSGYSTASDWFHTLEVQTEEKNMLREFLMQLRWFAGQREPLNAELCEFFKGLPIFIPAVSQLEAGETEFITLKQSCVPPEDLQPGIELWQQVLKGKRFVAAALPAERSLLVQHLGVAQLTKSQLIKEHLLPNLQFLEPSVREVIMVQLLRELALLKQTDPQLVDTLSSTKFVSTLSLKLAAPRELHDPRNSDLLLLLSPEDDFPSAAFAPVLDSLLSLGMHATASKETILKSAAGVEVLAGKDEELAATRARALFSFLEIEVINILGHNIHLAD